MRICFLSSLHPPFDKRVFDKQATTLAANGFDVTHICPYDKEIPITEGVKFITFTRPKSFMQRLKSNIKLFKLAKAQNADCLYCNEVDSWFIGLLLKLLKRGKRCKVVFDVHEHYPHRLAERLAPRCFNALFATVIRYLLYIPGCLTDQIVLAKSSLEVDFPGLSKKMITVSNYSRLVKYENIDKSQSLDDVFFQEGFIVAHLGLLSVVRGWPQCLHALTLTENKSIKLLVVGEINDGSQSQFQQYVQEQKLSHRVKMIPWQPYSIAHAILKKCNAGIISFQPGPYNHTHAFPHKLFDYMQAKLPVVAPYFSVEVNKIITASACGLLVNVQEPQVIADALDALAASEPDCKKWGENGFQAVLERYNWETEAGALINALNKLK